MVQPFYPHSILTARWTGGTHTLWAAAKESIRVIPSEWAPALLASCTTEECFTFCDGDDVTAPNHTHRVTIAAFKGNPLG